MDTAIKLETRRLILRCLELNDATIIRKLAGHPDIAATTLTIPHPYSLEEAVDFINYARRAVESDESYNLAITRRAEGDLIGCIGLSAGDRHRRAEMGYWMSVKHWGQGYTTEAARRVLQFGFETLDLNRIYATHFAGNPASGRVMQKIGMIYEGTLRQHIIKNGQPLDIVYYGILRSEYEGIKTVTGSP
jgi:[ribosomal protein S5]-alanine N-acetyltransferase